MVIQDYVVCYFDLLGQRAGLLNDVRKSYDLTTIQLEVDKVSTAIQRFNALIKGTKKSIVEDTEKLLEAGGLSGENKDVLSKKIKSLHLGVQQFSDTTLFFANIENGDCAGLGVFMTWCLLLAANFIQLLSEHLMVRGGITIGKGWEIEPACLYGPVIEDVYKLESKIAVFPRIVVSEETFCRLEVIEWPEFRLSKFFCRDYDGVHILDYLSLPAVQWYEAKFSVLRSNLIYALKEALRFIRTEYDLLKVKVSHDISCAKEARKLAYLISYWQSRLESIVDYYDSSSIDERKS